MLALFLQSPEEPVLSMKVIGSRSRLQEQKACLCILFAYDLPFNEIQSC